eukprot:gnl/TRDRNA2_/TRDRNA2_153961_c0_seq2.p1 gnl/TRDRNA2_/TRDRNA2_153961_c0~~gnl/TRDRNA2_/TRDRNA2_153961_c0_seq2.p1  ORF type:complete len:282 (-),score=30.34 gnl/TRDRNA2_/TRDRNA2_153961_c0_seq2:36-881(-)
MAHQGQSGWEATAWRQSSRQAFMNAWMSGTVPRPMGVDQRVGRQPVTGDSGELAGASAVESDVPLLLGEPLTAVMVTFRAPGGRQTVTVPALVDTGGIDCELREGIVKHLGLPLVRATRSYETSEGRLLQSTFAVELSILGRSCCSVVAAVPERRFQLDAVDPCTDDAIIGNRALMALGLIVDSGRGALLLGPQPVSPSAQPAQLNCPGRLEREAARRHRQSSKHMADLLAAAGLGQLDKDALVHGLSEWCRLYDSPDADLTRLVVSDSSQDPAPSAEQNG